MKRRTTRKSSKKIHADAMKQLRSLRDRLDQERPELLGDIRSQLFQAEQAEISAAGDSMIKMDRKKNIATVLKLLEMDTHSEDFKRQLAEML